MLFISFHCLYSALALIVFTDTAPNALPSRSKILILFHVTGAATLTLLINGTTSKKVLEWTKIITNGGVRRNYKKNYLERVKAISHETLLLMKTSDYFNLTDWKKVE